MKSHPVECPGWSSEPLSLLLGQRSNRHRVFRSATLPYGGEFGFDGGTESRDACRAPLTR
jgi:hypothetical protein